MNSVPLDNSPHVTQNAVFERRISASLLRLRSQAPFFAVLALFARMILRNDLPTAATDGRDVFFNQGFVDELNAAELDGLLLHEVLHAALLHLPRRGTREPLLWNIAADIVVNGIIANETPFTLPQGALREGALEKFSTEEVYELLGRDLKNLPFLAHPDLLEAKELGDDERRRILETYWQHARQQAAVLARASGIGKLPAGLVRELGALEPSHLDWRAHLWRYLVRTPVDFQGFDRRLLSRGLYLETLEGESLRVLVAVDTSGSVDNRQMDVFVGEVRGILAAYPHLQCELFYADAALYGPYSLNENQTIPAPVGGGGTDFRPFFEAVEREPFGVSTIGVSTIAVYLTDGMGVFPATSPSLPVLWVVTPGGLAPEKFPFGETVRLLEHG